MALDKNPLYSRRRIEKRERERGERRINGRKNTLSRLMFSSKLGGGGARRGGGYLIEYSEAED